MVFLYCLLEVESTVTSAGVIQGFVKGAGSSDEE